jgi:hypothetical protein
MKYLRDKETRNLILAVVSFILFTICMFGFKSCKAQTDTVPNCQAIAFNIKGVSVFMYSLPVNSYTTIGYFSFDGIDDRIKQSIDSVLFHYPLANGVIYNGPSFSYGSAIKIK